MKWQKILKTWGIILGGNLLHARCPPPDIALNRILKVSKCWLRRGTLRRERIMSLPTTGKRLSFLLLLIPATTSLAFLSPAATFTAAQPVASTGPQSVDAAKSPVSTNTVLCSSAGETANMAPPIPRWYQHEISITAPSRGCHLITSQVSNSHEAPKSICVSYACAQSIV